MKSFCASSCGFFFVINVFFTLMKENSCVVCSLSLCDETETEMRRYVDIYLRLAPVCNHFHDVVRDRRESHIIRRTLKGLTPVMELHKPPLHALINFFLEFNSWPWHTAITVFFLSASSFQQSYYVITPRGLDLTHSRGHSSRRTTFA